MYYSIFLEKGQEKPDNNLLMKVIERGKITEPGPRSINTNPYLLRFFKKRLNRPVL